MDRLRRYPEVIGGIHASFQDEDGRSETIECFSDLKEVYLSGRASIFSISGQNELDKEKRISFFLSRFENTAHFEIEASDDNYLKRLRSSFEKIFPHDPYHQLDYALLQRGFEYTAEKSKPLPNYREYSSRAKRKNARKQYGNDYGYFFERYCEAIALYELFWSTLLNVKIKGEGVGGDYDVLALAETTSDTIYLEAKTGDVSTKDFEEFCRRFKLLRPSFAVIIVDHSPDVLAAKLPYLQRAIKKVYDLEKAPEYIFLPTLKRRVACCLFRNIFIICGDDITKSLKHCARYYDGIIKQTSYFS